MGAVELRRVILATVFSDHVRRGTVPIMDLKEVIVAVGAALQVEERKGDPQNLVWVGTDYPGTADIVIVMIMTRGVGITEGASRASQVSSALLLCGLAERASPLRSASTCESINAVGAGSSVLTGVACALVDILVTVRSLPARVTVADVARSRGGGHTLSIDTGVVGLTDVAGLGAAIRSIPVACVAWRAGAYRKACAWG